MQVNRTRSIVEAYAEVARPQILRVARQDSCIFSTRVTICVLAHFGLVVRPVSVAATVMNAAYLECGAANGGSPPSTPEEMIRWGSEYGAYALDCGRKQLGRWSGHVVAIVGEELLVDASLDQINRPAWNLQVPGVVVADCTADFVRPGQAQCAYMAPNGSGVVYTRAGGPPTYLRSRDWHKDDLVGSIGRDIARLMNMALRRNG